MGAVRAVPRRDLRRPVNAAASVIYADRLMPPPGPGSAACRSATRAVEGCMVGVAGSGANHRRQARLARLWRPSEEGRCGNRHETLWRSYGFHISPKEA